MFFLLYVPNLLDRPLKAEDIEQVAEQFAEQLIQQARRQQTSADEQIDMAEISSRAKSELRAQIAAMLLQMQQERLANEQSFEDEPPQEEQESQELGEVRNFLERCYRESA
jgi:hypothetical protein